MSHSSMGLRVWGIHPLAKGSVLITVPSLGKSSGICGAFSPREVSYKSDLWKSTGHEWWKESHHQLHPLPFLSHSPQASSRVGILQMDIPHIAPLLFAWAELGLTLLPSSRFPSHMDFLVWTEEMKAPVQASSHSWYLSGLSFTDSLVSFKRWLYSSSFPLKQPRCTWYCSSGGFCGYRRGCGLWHLSSVVSLLLIHKHTCK